MAAVAPCLRLQGMHKRFGATVALDGVDFSVDRGEIHALVGENGAGKSTLVKILAGALRADAGEMQLDEQPYRPRHPQHSRQLGVAVIYQEFALAPHLTVAENITLGSEPGRWGLIDHRREAERARQALARMGHRDIPLDAPVATLSVAEKQLVEIARAIATGCQVLVLDEPTSALSHEDTQRLFALLRHLQGEGHAIIYISHFLEEVMHIAGRVTVLRDGRVAGSVLVAGLAIEQLVELMLGRRLDQLYPRSPRQPGDAILELRELAGLRKPAAASLTLHRGEVLGIAGLIGAGRTELLRAIFGLDAVRSGELRLGVHAGPASPLRRWQQGAGMLSEDRGNEGLAANLSIADNLTLSRLTGLGPAGLLWPSRQQRAAQKWIERLQIRCRQPQQPVRELSGGNQQKVALARLLHHDVDVLLLDEPTRGIDVASKSEIYQLIDALATATPPCAILMVSSYLPELLGVCDRIAVMHRGRLGPARPAQEWDEHRLLLAATGKEAA